MNRYIKLAKTLEAFAFLLKPNKIAGHSNQANVMREAAAAILELEKRDRERNAVIEQCAVAAAKCAHGLTYGVDRRVHHNNAVSDCVDAIKSLKDELCEVSQ